MSSSRLQNPVEADGKPRAGQTRRPSALPNSTWWKWSQDRRAAVAKREAENELKKNTVRVPTPIIKAREESMKFVAPELKDQHLPEDQKRVPPKKKKVKEKKGKKGKNEKKEQVVDSEKDLTLEQWNELIEYWDHHAFGFARLFGLGISFIAIIICIFVIVNDRWVSYVSRLQTDQKQYAGLWRRCVSSGDTCNSTLQVDHLERPYHQAVFSLMVSTTGVGFCAFIMLVFGFCITYLPQKIYYYHSSGEIFIVTAFLEFCGLVIYPIGVTRSNETMTVTLSYSYFLGWVSFGFFAITAICLLLDEMLRESSKPRTFFFSQWFKSKKKAKNNKNKNNVTVISA